MVGDPQNVDVAPVAHLAAHMVGFSGRWNMFAHEQEPQAKYGNK